MRPDIKKHVIHKWENENQDVQDIHIRTIEFFHQNPVRSSLKVLVTTSHCFHNNLEIRISNKTPIKDGLEQGCRILTL